MSVPPNEIPNEVPVSPAVVAPDWSVRIDTHFLGGRRHFRSWEIADIGVLVYLRDGAAGVPVRRFRFAAIPRSDA